MCATSPTVSAQCWKAPWEANFHKSLPIPSQFSSPGSLTAGLAPHQDNSSPHIGKLGEQEGGMVGKVHLELINLS